MDKKMVLTRARRQGGRATINASRRVRLSA